MKVRFLLMLLVIGVFAVSAQAAVIQIQPWWGNNITTSDPDLVYDAGHAMIYHNGNGRLDRQLQYYDLDSYAGQTVVSASYTWTTYEVWDYANTEIVMNPITEEWHKNTVTWNNQPAHGAAVLGTLTGMGGSGEGEGEWITRTIPVASIQAWLDSPSTNYGWKMKLTDAQEAGDRYGMDMYSSAHDGPGEPGPYLTLNIVPEPATMILLGLGGFVIRRRRK